MIIQEIAPEPWVVEFIKDEAERLKAAIEHSKKHGYSITRLEEHLNRLEASLERCKPIKVATYDSLTIEEKREIWGSIPKRELE